VPLWDELTVGIFLDPTIVTKQTTVLMDVDVSHGPGYGSARIWSDTVAPHTGERKVTVVQEVDVNRFTEAFVRAMQTTFGKRQAGDQTTYENSLTTPNINPAQCGQE